MKTKTTVDRSMSGNEKLFQMKQSSELFKRIAIVCLLFFATSSFATTTFKVRFFIQGYYERFHLMRHVGLNQGLSVSCDFVDNVTISLYNSSNCTLADEVSADLDIYGNCYPVFSTYVPNNYYYIGIKHRNSIETWSASPVQIIANTLNFYDFSTASTQAYDGNMIEIESGVWAIYNGDVNDPGDGYIASDDDIYIENNETEDQGVNSLYDINGDGIVDDEDYDIADFNNLLGVYTALPSCRASGHSNQHGNTESDENNFLRIYPNPSSGIITIKSHDVFGENTQLSIQNLTGIRIKTVALPANDNALTLSIEDLQPGAYICTLLRNDKAVLENIRFVKEK